MATGDYYSQPLVFKVPKRRRTESRHPSPPSDSWLTEDEKECILALLDLSRAPLINDEEMTPAEEDRSPLSPPEEVQQSQSLPSPSPSPPKQQQELSPISLPSLSQQDQQLPPPPLAERELPPLPPQGPQQNQPLPPPLPTEGDLPPLPPNQNQPLPPPLPAERDLPTLPPQQNQPLPPPPPAEINLPPLPPQQNQPLPPPPQAEGDLPPLPEQQNYQLPPPMSEQAPSLVLCPMPLRCYRPPLPPALPPIQQPSPFLSLTPIQHNQVRYVCPECGKVFSSYQALGGHKTSHRKRPAENSAAAASAVVTGATDQNKPHTCSLCYKSFATGQALGGHMRAHYEGNKRQATAKSRPMAAPSSSLTECSTAKGMEIDLNQPAMPEEEAVNSSHPAVVATSRPPRFFTFF